MELIEQIGAYAGFAAVLGLAVLSALYFSQARDVRRLREWAGRAPERAAQVEVEAQARAEAARVTPQAPPAKPAVPAVPKPGQPAAAPGSPAAKPGTASTQPAARPATAAGAVVQPGVRPATATAASPGANGAGKAPPIPSRAAAAATSILPPSARADSGVPWYARIPWPQPRYLALIVAGVLVVGGGAAYGISRLGGEGDGAARTPAAEAPGGGGGSGSGGAEEPESQAPVNPAEVTVAVLNGTTVNGLASQFGDTLQSLGYLTGNITNASDQAQAESVVLYSNGARREARAVAEAVDVTQTERIDPETQAAAGNATVVLVLGADKTP